MPITFFEGIREEEREELTRRNMERRFYALAAAVKEHEARLRRSGAEPERQDEVLYRRLRQISGTSSTAEHEVA